MNFSLAKREFSPRFPGFSDFSAPNFGAVTSLSSLWGSI
jgi:hypothetical protein